MKRDYLALCGILAVAFIFFFVLSIFEDFRIGSWQLRTSSLAEPLFGDKVSLAKADTLALSDSAATAAPVAQKWPVVLNPDSTRTILIIGDSMLEGLFPRLAAYCDASGYNLYSVIWYSSNTELYGESHLLADYIRLLSPDFVFLSIGGNELFVADVAQKRLPYVKNILADLGNTPYLWIGPPNWKDDTGINDLIRSNVRDGAFFTSKGMTFERKRDGAHPTSRSASLWMDSIIRWMPDNAAYVLPLKPPSVESARGRRVYVHPPGQLTNRPK